MDEFKYVYDASTFGKRLRAIRKKNGMTQEQLAEFLFLSVDSISNYENGKTTCMPEHLIKICQLFNVSADYFFFDIDRELISEEKSGLAQIIEILKKCTEFDLKRIYHMIQIILEKPAA